MSKTPGQRIEIRQADSLAAATQVASVIAELWGPSLAPTELLRALAGHGNPILGAYVGGRIVGGQMSFLALDGGRLQLHSHITGVLPHFQAAGVGTALKVAQREWCIEHGIEVVTWTFDPMLARNARFNFEKLGCVSNTFHRNFYGSLDDDFNRNDRSDRLEVRWEVTSAHVVESLQGRGQRQNVEDAHVLVTPKGDISGRSSAEVLVVHVPPDYLALRAADPERATSWRMKVADSLEWAFAQGYGIVGFAAENAYVLTMQADV